MLTANATLQNRYRIVRQLGQVGMGTVYEAIDEPFNTTCGRNAHVGAHYWLHGSEVRFRASLDVRISPDENLAYIFSSNAVTMNTPDGNSIAVTGRAVTISRREGEGKWRCAVDIWNAAE